MIKLYCQLMNTTYDSPLFPKEESSVSRMMCQCAMVRKEMPATDNMNEVTEEIHDVWQIFEHSRDNPFCSMLITAEPGFGKTTLLNKIVSIWCTAFDTFRHRSNISSDKRRNVLALQTFAFTFYISLCKLDNEESILQMITSQITGSSQYKSLEDILKNETCLFLLDGIHEWTASSHVKRKVIHSFRQCCKTCYVVYTATPGDISYFRHTATELDCVIEFKNIRRHDIQRFVEKGVRQLNLIYSQVTLSEEFLSFQTSNGLVEVKSKPLLLKFAVRLWYTSGILCNSITDLYNHMICLILNDHIPTTRHLEHEDENERDGEGLLHPKGGNVHREE